MAGLDDLLNFAFTWAQEIMAERGELYPIVHGITRNGDHVLIQPNPSIDSSVTRGALIQLAFVAYDVAAYAAISESWMLKVDPREGFTVRPSQSERRTEAICVMVSDGANKMMRIGEIKRDARGAYAGVELQPLPDEGEVGGVLGELLPLPPVSSLKRRLAREALHKNKQIMVRVMAGPPKT